MEKMNVFMKVRQVRELIKAELDENLTHKQLTQILQRIFNNWYRKKNKSKAKITKQEVEIYEILMNNSINPGTAYRWFLLANSPDELKQKLMTRKIGINQAFKEKRVLKKIYSVTERELLDDVLDCVNRYVVR